ncbi:putative intracellular septation protein A [Sulfuriferula plumbiphila]|uniref:Inner membrane-spanning protein YciB n=1 Tax=Sulfuriferula plumbiphila TaxID=171865 RepID=A0A512LB72_9PROT|nr:septation protein A [Sulfuriferula plumbiphila]BBP04308.1 putative intracellular septation protein A [Sulfuriferula plumbiphila]GEP31692.1 putative intracellular septation protein A [Sulfuriferula plumbiphila]
MKFLFDFFPILLFFIAYKFGGIYVATGVAIAASFVQIGWVMARGKKVETMMWVSLAIIVVFGGATLLLHNETFIKWKPTVLYWLFATILLGGSWLFNKNIIRSMMAKQVSLPEPVWNKLNLSWAGFFIVMGATNLYVAYNFSTDVWVDFKLFGSTAMMLVFVIAQSLILAKHMNNEE